MDFAARMSHYHVPGLGKVSAESLFHACSISKMVTAIGVLRLVQDGVLDLDEDVNRYLVSWRVPESPYTQHKKVTLRNLLAHQAGFVDTDGSFETYQEQDAVPRLTDILAGRTRYNPEPLLLPCQQRWPRRVEARPPLAA